VEVRGLRLHVREAGPPAGPPVLVLHGIMGHGREWDVLTSALAPAHRVLALDMRGHGRSEWADDYRVPVLAADAAALLERLGRAGVTVIGHSLGAMAAALLAADRPELVARAVLLDLPFDAIGDPSGLGWLRYALRGLGAAVYAEPETAVEEWLAADPFARHGLMRHYIAHVLVRGSDGRWRYRFDASGLARLAERGFDAEAIWAAVDRLTVPALVVRGARSEFLSAATAAEAARRAGDARVAEIPDAGHDLGVQRPEAVAAEVIDFLAGR
jgi:pimeloyl-ACP methyl ester carboxylesterase